jgi:hypothetical protein
MVPCTTEFVLERTFNSCNRIAKPPGRRHYQKLRTACASTAGK